MNSLPWRYSSPRPNRYFENSLLKIPLHLKANLCLFIIIFRVSQIVMLFSFFFFKPWHLCPLEMVMLWIIAVRRDSGGHLKAKTDTTFPESLPLKLLIDEHSYLHDCKACCNKTYFPPWPVKHLGLPPGVCRHWSYTHQSNIVCMAKLQQRAPGARLNISQGGATPNKRWDPVGGERLQQCRILGCSCYTHILRAPLCFWF